MMFLFSELADLVNGKTMVTNHSLNHLSRIISLQTLVEKITFNIVSGGVIKYPRLTADVHYESSKIVGEATITL